MNCGPRMMNFAAEPGGAGGFDRHSAILIGCFYYCFATIWQGFVTNLGGSGSIYVQADLEVLREREAINLDDTSLEELDWMKLFEKFARCRGDGKQLKIKRLSLHGCNLSENVAERLGVALAYSCPVRFYLDFRLMFRLMFPLMFRLILLLMFRLGSRVPFLARKPRAGP